MKVLVIFTGCFLLFNSCTTYFISIESFKEQFSGIDSSKLKDVTVRGPGYEIYHYNANPIEKIKCVDESGVPFELINKPSIEMRLTYGIRDRRVVFYFDRVLIVNNTIVGCQSRFMDFIRKTVPLDSITKIEVQDGHKKFTYATKR